MSFEIIHGDCAEVLPTLKDGTYRLIYIDPPFNTGKDQTRISDADGEERSYEDSFDDFEGFIKPKIEQAKRLLTPDGSFMIHLDYREVHYVKVLCDKIFGRAHFINEIIWSFDFGGRSKKKYSNKHNHILWYAKDPKNYVFKFDELERIPYMAPAFIGDPEKINKGKTITSVIWSTIVPTNGKENLKYPTQKPLNLINKFVTVHTDKGDNVLDFFAGSGTVGEAALMHERNATLIDTNPQAIEVMRKRLEKYKKDSK